MRKSVSARPQTARVGQLLFVAQQAAQALAIERLEPLGLSPRAWGVLSTLAESGPMNQIELATTMSIDRTAMVYLLDELEDQMLIERVRSTRDRRAFLIHLTQSGRESQHRAAAALAGAADALLAPLDLAERQQLVDLLAKVAAHWQQVTASQPHPATSQARLPAGSSQPPARKRKAVSAPGPQTATPGDRQNHAQKPRHATSSPPGGGQGSPRRSPGQA